MTYTKRNDVDLSDGKHGWLSGDVVTLDPEDHCCLLARYGAGEGAQCGLLDPPDWPTCVRNAKNKGTEACQHPSLEVAIQISHRGRRATWCASV